jgi:PAS domain S-box-containing protein
MSDTDGFHRAVLDALTSSIAVVQGDGTILSTNEAWRRFARDNGASEETVLGVGTNYLTVCEMAAGGNAEVSAAALEGIRAVLDGSRPHFSLEYPCHSPGERRWFVMTVAPLPGPAPRAVISHQNITANKLAADALRESEERFRAVFEWSPITLGLTSRDGGLLDVNRAFTENLGFSRDQVIGNAPAVRAMWVDPDERRRYFELLERQGSVTNFETALRRQDGEVLTGLFSGRAVSVGGKSYSLVSMMDITERKRTERALELLSTGTAHLSGESFFDTIARQLASVLDVEIAFVGTLPDRHRLRTLGLAVDGESRRAPWEFDLSDTPCGLALDGQDAVYLEDVRQRFPRFRQIVDENVSGYAGIPLFDTDGRPLGVLAVMSRTPLRRWEQTRAILRLFAVRTAAELARQRTEKQFHDLFEFSPDAILMVDDAGIITLANRQAVTMLGYRREELVGLPVDELVPEAARSRHAPHRAWFVAAAHPRLMGTRPTLSARRKDGTVFPAGIGLSPVNSDAGVRVIVALRDLTEQVRAEDRREALHAQLRQSQKMQAIGTLASGIAHDFNNILMIAQANLELAQRHLDPAHRAAESLGEIGVALARAGDLVHQILTFSREQPSKRTVISLRGVLEETGRLLRSALPAAVSLDITLDEAPPVLADASQIHQVLMNLGTNAWHALEGQPGSITMSLDTETIAGSEESEDSMPEALTPGRYARISVRDTGKGMDAPILERIFEPFFTTKAVGTGTGLGLAMVHGIVTDHGGCVTVESCPGQGSTFHVYLPAAEGPRALLSSRPPRAPSGDGIRVMCIDDEAMLARVTEHLLAPLGYRVRTCTSATDALQAIRSEPTAYDVVVSDFNMPELSGLEVAAEVARIRPDLPVVLVSGYVSEDTRRRAAAAGVRQVLQKPYTGAMLSAVLLRLVRGE